jgi:ATP-dependent Clp protease protease subunit
MRVVVPMVVESTARGDRYDDIYSRLLRDRIIFVGGEIDDDLANLVTAQLLFLDGEDAEKEINLYINTPGGSVTAAMSIYDTMQYVRPRVGTICLGMAASGGSLLLAAGEKGMRLTLPNSMVMIHQPWAEGMRGQATDLERHAREILRQRDQLIAIYSRHTGRTPQQVEAELERDNYMSAEAALEYGIVDHIVTHPPRPA